MSQTANAPRQQQTEARAYGKLVRSSARKLNLVAAMIRGKSAGAALADLRFCERRIAQDVTKVLQSAIANAENNHQLDVDRLYVHEATVGRAFVMKRFHTRGRGRSAQIQKPYSNLTVIVREAEPVVKETVAKKAPAKAATKTPDVKTVEQEKAPAKKASKKQTGAGE